MLPQLGRSGIPPTLGRQRFIQSLSRQIAVTSLPSTSISCFRGGCFHHRSFQPAIWRRSYQSGPVYGKQERRLNGPIAYEPLDTSKSDIRLLEWCGTETEARWRLIIVPLEEAPEYKALSYVWGTSDETEDVILNDRAIPVKKSLTGALGRLHEDWVGWQASRIIVVHEDQVKWQGKPHGRLFVWTDALCINQLDEEEKSSQVPLMATIYSSAQVVISWLGPPDEEVYYAMDTIKLIHETWSRELSDESNGIKPLLDLKWLLYHPSLCESRVGENSAEATSAAWNAVARFTALEYWRRIWIFQEIALANHVILVCGENSIEWDVVSFVAMISIALKDELFHNDKPDFVSVHAWMALTIHAKEQWAMIATYSLAAHRVKARDNPNEFPTGWDLAIFAATHLRATNPKDHIYGILGATGLPISPDYSRKTATKALYCEFVAKYIEAWQSGARWKHPELFFLLVAGQIDAPNTLDLPSWVPNFPAISEGASLQLTEMPEHAAADASVFSHETPNSTISGSILFTSGVHLTDITETQPFELDGAIYHRKFEFLQKFVSRSAEYPTGIPSLQAALRLLDVQGLGRNISYGMSDMPRLLGCLVLLLKMAQGGQRLATTDIQSLEMLGIEMGSPSSFSNSIINALMSDPCAVITEETVEIMTLYEYFKTSKALGDWDVPLGDTSKRYDPKAFTTSSGHIGISRRTIQAGDRVYVLKGFNQLVVLREALDGKYNTYIAPCFILGLSHGEAKEYCDSGKAKVSRLEIR